MRAFKPGSHSTANITASSASARVVLPSSYETVQVWNSGTDLAYIEFGDSTVTASATNSLPIPAGALMTFSVPGSTHMAVIAPTGTPVLYATGGVGL